MLAASELMIYWGYHFIFKVMSTEANSVNRALMGIGLEAGQGVWARGGPSLVWCSFRALLLEE